MTQTVRISASEQWLDGTGGRLFIWHLEPEGQSEASLVDLLPDSARIARSTSVRPRSSLAMALP